jgi:succinate dehydrogenase / fumarate reductase cytochrome b subunit
MNAPPLTGHFVLRKLHSLTGIIPIGAFLIFHLFENSLAGGLVHLDRAEWTRDVVMKIDTMPYVMLLEIFVIALPILFHGIYGVIIWLQGRSNLTRYGYARNWMYVVQRVSGAVAFVFILTHVWETRVQVLLGHMAKQDLYAKMAEEFSGAGGAIWYAVGILAAVIHLCNGIWLAGITWGITIGPRAQRISTVVCALIGVLLLGFAGQAMLGFRLDSAAAGLMSLR